MLACIRCGLCLTSCPTYVLSLDESESPRGRVGMARAVAEGHLAISPTLIQHELNCLVCDACSAVCPAGVHMDPLQVVLRAALAADQPRPWTERLMRWAVFGWLFMDMRRFRLLARLLWLYQRLGLRFLARRLGILRFLRLDTAERLLPDLSGDFVVPWGEVYPSIRPEDLGKSVVPKGPDSSPRQASAPPAGAPTDVAFFAGCVMSTALAEIDRATIRVLQRAGCRVTNPRRQGCCGALHAHSGDLPRALELARTNIAAFEQTDGPIVNNSAGCGAMLKDYAHHLRHDPEWADRASTFSARVRDLSEVLAAQPPLQSEPLNATVVYQDACHLLHAQRISRQPRDLLRRIPGVDLAEIADAGLCCGSAGVYNVTNPVESARLRRRKLDNALARNPAVIVTANPGCLLQLKSGLAERRSQVKVKHLAEILDKTSRDTWPLPGSSSPAAMGLSRRRDNVNR